MRDPDEGMSPDGTIRTGVARAKVPPRFEPVLDAVVEEFGERGSATAAYIYGSVATGRAEVGRSDVDLLVLGISSADAARVAATLSERFGPICRAVEVAVVEPSELMGHGDEAYGNRAFLRHYCVNLCGPDLARELPDFPADGRAARGFNGDIGRHLARWCSAFDDGADPAALGRTVARKTLLAVAGLVSIREGTWTTDRVTAAELWARLEPAAAPDLATLAAWSDGEIEAGHGEVGEMLAGPVADVVTAFEATIGLWSDGSTGDASRVSGDDELR